MFFKIKSAKIIVERSNQGAWGSYIYLFHVTTYGPDWLHFLRTVRGVPLPFLCRWVVSQSLSLNHLFLSLFSSLLSHLIFFLCLHLSPHLSVVFSSLPFSPFHNCFSPHIFVSLSPLFLSLPAVCFLLFLSQHHLLPTYPFFPTGPFTRYCQ